ncbi:hypothetical protein X927_00995 [Petrotoga mexicana DSM 14811]|uniref:Uncharacterized protein n=1 Tax=Petrotoga mexicana DSM 14811 TaxID=1122954 RepID=A0A2K1PEK3_9BACT|nr:hypothetical protein X927_00995 [Petrotoga mexicana DSM 14811]
MISRLFCGRDCDFAALCKKLLLICAKWFVCNALEMFPKTRFYANDVLNLGILRGNPLNVRAKGALNEVSKDTMKIIFGRFKKWTKS